MHRYEELEKLYYKKKYFKLFFRTILVLVLIGLSIFIYNLQNKKKPIIQPTKIIEKNITKKETIEVNKTEKNTTIKEINKTKDNLKTFKIPKNIKKLILYPIYPKVKVIKDTNTTKKITSKNVTSKQKTSSKIEKIEEKPQPKLKIIVKSEKQTLSDMITLFNSSKDYSLAMKIANIYYSKQDYINAIKWSKTANTIKPEKYDSWYLFAKSLLKLNKKEEAKKVLITYLNTYGNNDKIVDLLRSIK